MLLIEKWYVWNGIDNKLLFNSYCIFVDKIKYLLFLFLGYVVFIECLRQCVQLCPHDCGPVYLHWKTPSLLRNYDRKASNFGNCLHLGGECSLHSKRNSMGIQCRWGRSLWFCDNKPLSWWHPHYQRHTKSCFHVLYFGTNLWEDYTHILETHQQRATFQVKLKSHDQLSTVLLQLTQVIFCSLDWKASWVHCPRTSQKLQFSQVLNQHGTTWAVTSKCMVLGYPHLNGCKILKNGPILTI